MFRLPIRNFLKREKTPLFRGLCFIAPGVLPLFMGACAFADLRSINISTVPRNPWDLLPGQDSPVVLRFDTDMERTSVERVFQVYSPEGITGGEVSWKGTGLSFTPRSPWKPGIRYALKISGTVTARDGRELLISREIPFFAVSRSPLPYVKSFLPRDGESVGIYGMNAVEEPEHKILELVFSEAMERKSTEDAFKLDTPGEKIFRWHDDNRTLVIASAVPLNPWLVYRWSLSEKAVSENGAPLAGEFSGRFITDRDRDFITVLRVLPLMPQDYPAPSRAGRDVWSPWIPAAPDLEQGPGPGQGIGIEFGKEPEKESLLRAFSFVPPLPGRVEILSPLSAVFIPSKDPEPETVYAMRVSGNLKDAAGLKMGSDYTTVFKTDIRYLFLNSFFSGTRESAIPKAESRVPVTVHTGGIIRFILNFSLPFDSEDQSFKEQCVFKISLKPYFPGTLRPVSLRSARWISRDRLLMEWEGPEPGVSGEPHYYKMVIPGGAGGVHNGKGSFFKKDFILYLEAEK